jgi:hypothetical protein
MFLTLIKGFFQLASMLAKKKRKIMKVATRKKNMRGEEPSVICLIAVAFGVEDDVIRNVPENFKSLMMNAWEARLKSDT